MKAIKRVNKLKIMIVMIAILMLMTALFFNYFFISKDISLPYTLWLKGVSRAEYKKNSYVMAKTNDPRLTTYDYIIKNISCISGERLTVKKEEVFCNDIYIGEILDRDKRGKELKSFMDSGTEIIVPTGYYFLSGSHKRSYDSRYFGLVSGKDIMLTVYPIL